MVRKNFHLYFLLLALAGANSGRASTILIGSVEDTPGSSGFERNGDYNDVMFALTGNFTINAPGGVFNNLTTSIVNEAGTVFWDNPSQDAADMNAGYMLLSDSSFHGLQYLAMPDGSSVNDVTFDAAGPVTLTVLNGITLDSDTLGWYNPTNPNSLHLLATSADSPGDTITFNPHGEFALYSTDGMGQTYSSMAASNLGESAAQQHFAFFEEPGCGPPPPSVPEPSPAAMLGIGVALLGVGLVSRRKR